MRARRVNTGTGTVPPSYVRMGERCLSRCSRQICGLRFVILYVEGQICGLRFVILCVERQICGLRFVILYVEGQICGLRFVILCVEGQICGLRFVILYVEGQIYGLRYVILYVEGQICKHWDRHRSPFQRPYGGNDACPYVHGTVLVPMFTLSRCSRNGSSLFTVRC